MKKILTILSAIALTSTASVNIIACDKGENPTPPTPDTKMDLTKIITEKKLGWITMIGNQPTKTELLTAIQNNNEAAKALEPV